MGRSFQVHFRSDFVIIGVALTVLGQLWEPFGAPWAVLVHLLGQALARGRLDRFWGRSRARFDCKNRWFSHNVELVTDATDAAEVVSSTAARTTPSTRAGGQDDVS